MTTYIYNFYGTIYETNEPFDETYRKLMREAKANGEPVSRQVIKGERITNERYINGMWF